MTAVTDITESSAAQAAATMEQFMSVAVHDLRNPVAVVKASAQMALRQWKRGDTESAIHRVDAIVTQADRLAELLEVFLDATRVETGRLVLRTEAVVLADELLVAAERARFLAGERAQRVIEYTSVEGCVGQWDRARINRAFKALIENALLYGHAEMPVRVVAQVQANRLCLRVFGAGDGPSAADVPHLFERFFRGHVAAEVGHSGSGLGLFTARGIARAHGGDVCYAPRMAADAFELELPLALA